MVAPITLARALREASVWLYPTDVAETFCIIAIKARAAGCIPVTSALGALPQTAAGGILLPPPLGEVDELYAQAFVDAAVQSVAASDMERLRMSQEAMETYDIRGVVRQWAVLLDA